MSRMSHTDLRRKRLARRVESLEAMEPRAMITESLGILSLGIGVPTALAGPKDAGVEIRTGDKTAQIGLRDQAQPEKIPLRLVPSDIGGSSSSAVLPISSSRKNADSSPDENTSPDQPAVLSSSAPFAPSSGGGGAASRGSGPVAGGAIRPLRFAPPPDLSSSSSTLVAGAGSPRLAPPAGGASKGTTIPGGVPPGSPPAPNPPGSGVGTSSFDLDSSGGGSNSLGLGESDPGLFTVTGADRDVALGNFDNFVLYTVDYNDGVVLFPGNVEVGTPGNKEDLRAQVRDDTTSSYTYSWDTSNMGLATGITGASTYRLQFQWTPSVGYAATNWTTLTVTNGSSQTEVQTYSFRIVPLTGAGSGGGTTTWPESLAPDLIRPEAPAFASHNVSIDAAVGAVDTAIALPSYNPNVAPLVFSYDSMAADPRPIVVEHHVLDDSKAVPDKVTASLTFNGTTGSTSYYDTSKWIAGDIQQIALQVDATALSTGRYGYTVNWGDVRGGTTTSGTATGTATVLNEAANAFGAGWTLAGLEKITAPYGAGGVILATGYGGRTLWFSGTPSSGGGSYTSPAGEFSTLAKTGSGTYTRTMADGTVRYYDTNGRETASADLNGLRVTYAYDMGGKLTSVTDPYAGITTIAYDGSSLLRTATDPAGRITTFSHTGADLTSVTLPDSAGWSYGYTAHRLTSVTDPRAKITTVAYDAANRANTLTRPDATTDVFVAEQVRGFVTGTSSGSPGVATLLAEAKATHTDANGHKADARPDWRGMGLVNQATDADGDVSMTHRDSNGLATIAVDRLNRITTYTYDAKGNVTALTNPDQTTRTYSYNSFSEVTAATNEVGSTTNYTYDGEGNLTVVQDALTYRTTMTYTANGRVETVKDANSQVTSYAYDSKDRLTTVTHPKIGAAASATTLLAYDTKGNVATVTDERGNSTTISYDALNRQTGVKDALGNRTTIVYDSGGNATQVQAPLSRTTAYAYDVMNRMTTVTDPLSHVTVLGYDSGGNLKTTTDPLSRTTTLAYDAEDRNTQVTTPISGGTTRTATTTYDAEGQVLTAADFLNRVTTTVYNSRGWAATVTDPLGNVTTYAYSGTGQPTAVTDPSQSGGTLFALTYDAIGQRTVVTDALGHATTTVYDGVGNVTAVQAPLSRTTNYAYDARNRLTTVTDPLSHATVLGYDSGGNKTSVTDALSHATATAYDALNRPTTLTDARSAVTTIAYDAAGRRAGLTDPVGNRTTWAYDAADRMTTETAPVPSGQNGVSTFAYDNADQLTDKTDRNGRRITYAYDSGGRRTNERWLTSSGGTVRTITTTYDAADQVTAISDPDALLTFTYDSGGRRLTAATSSAAGQPSVTLTSTFDQSGERTTLVDSLASVGRTTYGYDAAHRLTRIDRTYGGSAGPRVDYGHDDADRLTTQSRTIGGTGTAVATTLAYDAADRLGTLTHRMAGGSVLATFLYSYDNANRVTGETNAEGTVAYAYDNANQLTGVTGARSESYSYDSGGNRTMTGYTTAAGNELTASPGYTYTYDDEGNQTAKTETATGKVTTFSYDYRNRMTGATQKNSGGTVIMLAIYTYDAIGRRIGINVDADGAGAGAAVQTWTIYDGDNTYADFNSAGTIQTRYLHGPAIDALLARTSSGGTTAWYLTDKLGSVRDIVSTAGAVVDHLAYDGFGRTLSESSPSTGDRFKFVGREYDNETEIYYNRARYYGPLEGRFTKRDPIGFSSQDTNIYRYTKNGPVNATDPTGLFSDSPAGSDSSNDSTSGSEGSDSSGRNYYQYWQYFGYLGLSVVYLRWVEEFGNKFGEDYKVAMWKLDPAMSAEKSRDASNAARHASGMTYASILYGHGTSVVIGNIHEYSKIPEQEARLMDSIIDQYNNARAREVAARIKAQKGFIYLNDAQVRETIAYQIKAELGKGTFILNSQDSRMKDARIEYEAQKKAYNRMYGYKQ